MKWLAYRSRGSAEYDAFMIWSSPESFMIGQVVVSNDCADATNYLTRDYQEQVGVVAAQRMIPLGPGLDLWRGAEKRLTFSKLFEIAWLFKIGVRKNTQQVDGQECFSKL